MPAVHSPDNGHALTTPTEVVEQLVASVRSGRSDDGFLFDVFATLAREAGREDLHAELTRRANGTSPLPAPSVPRVYPKAESHHKEGCRLVRLGKLAEAETAFREAIRVNPNHHERTATLALLWDNCDDCPKLKPPFGSRSD